MHNEQIIYAGNQTTATSALVLVHGRGGSADDILSIARHLAVPDFLLAAPQATGHSWYPQSFLAPVAQNEPWLTSALELLGTLVTSLEGRGIPAERIFLAGFSQGACLTLEFAARHARRYGGIAAFTGGLIGDVLQTDKYAGSFDATPVFIGTSDPDMHVPVTRVRETEAVLKTMHANVAVQVYGNMGHTIIQDELDRANTHLFG